MDRSEGSSAEFIGSQVDITAHAALIQTQQAFMMKAKAQDISDRLAPVPQFPPSAYIGMMALGPFALISPAIATMSMNTIRRSRVKRLNAKADELLSQSKGIR